MQQQQQQWRQQSSSTFRSNKPALTIDCVIPNEQTAQQVLSEFAREQSTQEVAYRREQDGTPHVRIQLPPSAVSQFRQHLEKVAEAAERSYQQAGLTSQ